ncbi:unnamed protein product [Heterobilharzia americana]|nr:unnamed protein product [Heterobilharzia americana]CAH8627929.1 unnamed protein product [Heterobilharzia americana]
MNKLQEEIVVQEVVRNELKQTVSSQVPIYERFGGNVFLPVSRTKALMNCEERLRRMHSKATSGSKSNK